MTAPIRRDLLPLLNHLYAADKAAREAYEAAPPAAGGSWERVVLAGVFEDLAGPIAQVRRLVYGEDGAA